MEATVRQRFLSGSSIGVRSLRCAPAAAENVFNGFVTRGKLCIYKLTDNVTLELVSLTVVALTLQACNVSMTHFKQDFGVQSIYQVGLW